MDDGEVFKFIYLVAVPSLQWVLNTYVTNPASPADLTFGQVDPNLLFL